MIDPKELKIGNWVLENGKSEKQIIVITDDYALTSTPGVQNIDPVPLTEEWLLKFGLKPNKVIEYRNHGTADVYYLSFHRKRAEICRHGMTTGWAPCEYVHQLQNLYFALTGEELKTDQ